MNNEQLTNNELRTMNNELRSIKIESIMQNKPNLLNAQMNVSSVITKDYQNTHLLEHPKTNPKQTQFKANTNPIQTQYPKGQK